MRWSDVAFYFQVDIFTFWLALGIIVFWAALWILHAIAITYGTWKLHRKVGVTTGNGVSGSGNGGGSRVNSGEGGSPPGVSILKPLVGSSDPNLFSNLETFFTQNYPTFELLFCFHSEDDPALVIVETLIKKYPFVDCRIFKVREDTLMDMVNHMTDKVGMLTQMPFVCDRSTTFANTLEKVFFGAYHARMYLGADLLGILCCTGMSSMMRKQLLDECGGMKAFGKYIAEDFFMGKTTVEKGWKIAISSQPAWQNHGCATVYSFHMRVARWAKLRIAMLPHMIPLEIIQECILNGLLTGWAVNFLFEWNSLIFFLIHVLCWMLMDYALLSTVQNGPLPFGRFEFAVSWLYRELTALPTFIYALLRPEIRWRDSGTYKIEWGGLAVKIRDGAGNRICPPPNGLHGASLSSTTFENYTANGGKSSNSSIKDDCCLLTTAVVKENEEDYSQLRQQFSPPPLYDDDDSCYDSRNNHRLLATAAPHQPPHHHSSFSNSTFSAAAAAAAAPFPPSPSTQSNSNSMSSSPLSKSTTIITTSQGNVDCSRISYSPSRSFVSHNNVPEVINITGPLGGRNDNNNSDNNNSVVIGIGGVIDRQQSFQAHSRSPSLRSQSEII